MSETRPFQVLIKPVSADCNLRCEYCFYLRASELYPDEQRHLMPDDVLETVIQGLLKHRFPQTVFAWQGGEPTLAGVDFFERVVELEQKHGAPGQSVGNALQTNGILIDDDWCRLFNDYKFLIGLSLDGPEGVHDRFRRFGSGQGTWARVMEAARRMERHQVAYNILCVVNNENVALGADLLRWFVAQGFQYVQFIPCVEKDHPCTVPPEAFGDFLCDVFDYWAKEGFGRVSVRDFDAMLSERAGQAPAMCTFAARCNHYILIEHNGDVYPCDFFAYEEWKLGNVMEAPLESFLETERYRQFAYQKDKVPACRGCRWRAVCHGGCQKDRLLAGSFAEPSVLCPAYQKFFAHANARITRLAKRVMQQANPPAR
ncbi:MAG: anaerobic sulfatase maturase [Candidatus Hydrogenedentes bacterium]|nr:anaerobic sulfatase maturase [Candidatus Hydrogenedentota bacterium]